MKFPLKVADKVSEIYEILDGLTNEDAITALLATMSCMLVDYPDEHIFDFLEDLPNIVKNGIESFKQE